ncbi:hypothetical protein NSE01_35890 [Novosphingobium sediminis]|uniref:Flagellar FliJ protein n=1 Tax=Novosphingobium sediminis TaxID=707214 RepID=A0A512AQ85_9SPHN|nr:hypothetical protein [Novosphingobium sediminis]GEO01757.1 hypothetical protein NSE01_35890 [Novosphingobium sediminis]
MSADKAKLKRLRRLERLRSIARQTALTEAARAEAALAQVANLEARTAALIDAYRLRRDAATGADLRQSKQFVAGLNRIADGAAADLVRARQTADTRAAEAAEAERRRAAVDDRIEAARQRIARKASENAHPAKPVKPLGTPLE